MTTQLELALTAAALAGGVIHAAASDKALLQVRAQRSNDFVTQVDLASEHPQVRAAPSPPPAGVQAKWRSHICLRGIHSAHAAGRLP